MPIPPYDPVALCGIAAAAALFTWCLIRLAPGVGWLDGGVERDRALAHRKPQARPVPPVGGAALFLAGALALGLGWGAELGVVWFGVRLAAGPIVLALTLAFVAGLIDDLSAGGLSPRAKLAAQALSASPLVLAALVAGSPGCAVLLLVGAMVALNAANTFDNSDGAMAGLACVGLAAGAPWAAAALVGFLPFNLVAGGAREERSLAASPTGRAPHAYLGDAGSHVLGMLLFLTPWAWPVLALPVFDLFG